MKIYKTSFWAFDFYKKYRIQIYHPALILSNNEIHFALNISFRWAKSKEDWCIGITYLGFGIGIMKSIELKEDKKQPTHSSQEGKE
jgi:hypothetical protein